MPNLNPVYKAPSFNNLYETLGGTINDVRPDLDRLNWELEHYRKIEKEYNLKSNPLFQTLVLCDEILLGINYSAIELCATLRATLCCYSQFENLYHTKFIYTNIIECYKFLYFFKNTKDRPKSKAVLKKLQQRLTELKLSQSNTELDAITNDLLDFGELELGKRDLRNITYHYNQDIDFVYNLTISTNLEEMVKYVCNPFLALTERIREFVNKLKLAINSLLTKPLINEKHIRCEISIVSGVISRVAEQFNKKESFVPLLENNIEQASKNLDEYYFLKRCFQNVTEHLLKATQAKTLPKVLWEIQELVSAQMLINFMKGDLACALRNYIIAETLFEKEFFLSRIYITKDAALEHFYGFNKEQQEKSLWKSILAMIPANDDDDLTRESKVFSNMFENICKEDPERDILAHIADKGRNNVPYILNTLDDTKLLKNLNVSYDLVRISKLVEKFLDSLLKSLNSAQKAELKSAKQEIKKQFDNIQELVKKVPMQSDAKRDFIKNIEDCNIKLMEVFE